MLTRLKESSYNISGLPQVLVETSMIVNQPTSTTAICYLHCLDVIAQQQNPASAGPWTYDAQFRLGSVSQFGASLPAQIQA